MFNERAKPWRSSRLQARPHKARATGEGYGRSCSLAMPARFNAWSTTGDYVLLMGARRQLGHYAAVSLVYFLRSRNVAQQHAVAQHRSDVSSQLLSIPNIYTSSIRTVFLSGKYLHAVLCHEERVLPLRARLLVAGDDLPSVWSSASINTFHVPMFIIGSMVNTMPGTSSMPVPLCPKCITSGSSWNLMPTPWPQRSRTMP